MKIICEKNAFIEGINIAKKAIPSRTTMPILECILIDATNGQIKLISNDMDMFGIETFIKGNIIEKGMVAIKANTLFDIIRSMPGNEIEIETELNNEAIVSHISCGKVSFDINSMKGEEFSFLPYVEKERSFRISKYSLKEVIKQTIFSIATNDNNKLMTGVLFEINNDKLKVATLDGNRISQRIIDIDNCEFATRITVPGKTLNEISKIILGDLNDDTEIYITKNHIVFNFDETVVVSRLIEGEYFNIDQMMSKEYDTKIFVDKKMLLECIERATLLIREGEKKPIIFKINEDNIEIKMKSQLGKMDESIQVDKEGNDLLIGFNPNFFIEALRVIDDKNVNLYFTSIHSPCFIRDDIDSYDYLILPLQFSSDVNL